MLSCFYSLNLSRSTCIVNCIKGKQKTAGGFTWKLNNSDDYKSKGN